jgi:hypothetical protein
MPASWHSLSRIPEQKKKHSVLDPVRNLNKKSQSGTEMFRYHTEITVAGMSMPTKLALMPMPSYGNQVWCKA